MARERILLDTTYLLPLFGIHLNLRGYEEMFPRLLGEFEVLYTPVSLVEAKWIILKLARRKPTLRDRLLREYRAGLDALMADERLRATVLTNSMIEDIADHLLGLGLRDYFDRMIYATAYYYDSILLTEDEALHDIRSKAGEYAVREVISWRDIAGILEREG